MTPIHLTNQDLLNAAWEQAKLKTRSEDGRACKYRGPNGAKCFIGAAIPDERYDPRIEGRPLCYAFDKVYMTMGNVKLAVALQMVHDYHPVNEWDRRLRELAQEYALTIPGETK